MDCAKAASGRGTRSWPWNKVLERKDGNPCSPLPSNNSPSSSPRRANSTPRRPAVPDDGSNPSDDKDVAILEDTADNPSGEELAAAIDLLNDDQKAELLALVWIGRGDLDVADWPAAIAQARESRDGRLTDYLVGTPLLGDYLEEGASALGLSLEDFERG